MENFVTMDSSAASLSRGLTTIMRKRPTLADVWSANFSSSESSYCQ